MVLGANSSGGYLNHVVPGNDVWAETSKTQGADIPPDDSRIVGDIDGDGLYDHLGYLTDPLLPASKDSLSLVLADGVGWTNVDTSYIASARAVMPSPLGGKP